MASALSTSLSCSMMRSVASAAAQATGWAGVGVRMHVLLRAAGGEGVRQMGPRDAGRQRDIARGDALGHRHEIGYHAVVLAREPAPGAPEAGDDLVRDHRARPARRRSRAPHAASRWAA